MPRQSVTDIIYSVIQVEEGGAEFYRKLAGETRNPAVREVFLRLVGDEVKHQKVFSDLARAMEKESLSIESSANLAEVMLSVADKLKRIMKGSELVDMGGAGLKQAIDIGIHNERESIRVYSELSEIKYPGFSAVLNRIIGEEKKHLNQLEKMKAERLQ